MSSDFLKHCYERASRLASKQVLVGLDGFVDRIVAAVEKHSGPGEQFEAIKTLKDLGERITSAAGQSTNVELFLKREKIGGNGPIFAHALLKSNIHIKALGAFGEGAVHPLFEDFARKTEAVSLCDPGLTHAIECDDGKLMLGMMSHFERITYEHILKVMGEGSLIDAISRADLIAFLNWTMVPHGTSILASLVDKVLPNLGPRDRRVFLFDPADPEKRSDADFLAYLKQLTRFHAFGRVVLSVNLKEAGAVARVLGLRAMDGSKEALLQGVTEIRRAIDIECMVIHTARGAVCASRSDAYWVPVAYCDAPLISTGGGDHFNAGFALGELLELPPQECLELAVAYAGFYIRKGKSPALSDIEAFLASEFSLEF